MPIQNIGFQTPDPYGASQIGIERRRKLAEALSAQGDQPLDPSQSSGGWAIPISPFQGLAKLAQAGAGAYGSYAADKAEKTLSDKYHSDLSQTLSDALRVSGTHQEPVNTSQEGTGSFDMSGSEGPATQTVPGSRDKLIQALMGHPATQALAMQQMGQDLSTQGFVSAGAAQTPQGNPMVPGGSGSSVMAGSGSSIPSGVPPQAFGGPAGGTPMAVWLRSDPTGKSYLEQLAKDQAPINVRPGGTVYIPGQGAQFYAPKLAEGMTTGPGGVVQPQQGYAETRTAQSATPLLNAPMVKVPVSNQRTLDLTQPEQIRFTQTGGKVLPTRFQSLAAELPGVTFSDDAKSQATAGPSQPVVPSPVLSAKGAVKPADVGVVGATQSQQEQIQQAGQTAANTEAGKEFISEMRQNYAKLRDVPATLANMDRAKNLATTEAKAFMGPFGDSKLAITKFFRANVPGMANLKTESVTSAEELQSTLFNQVMDNLKKMDASPSQYQQQVMQEAFGTLRTDPQSVPKILDVFSDILRNRVSLHNDTVSSAEKRGTAFPYDVKVKLPKSGQQLDLSPATVDFMKKNGIKLPGE